VQLFFANDEEGNIVIIYDLNDEDRNRTFTCPVCDSEVNPVCIGGKTVKGDWSKISSHFSHFDSTKCTPETRIHFWTKNKFLSVGDKFTVKAAVVQDYICKEILIEEPFTVGDKKYIPDITIITDCGHTIFFEMNYTNKKKVKDYLDIWTEIGNIVIEIDVKTLINVSKFKDCSFVALYYNGKCFDKAINNIYENTIGKYITNISDKYSNEEIRERLAKLDWFWREVIKYKKEESDIELLTTLIDCNENEEKEIIFDILSRKSCVPMYEDYINYKFNSIYNNVKSFLSSFMDGKYLKSIRTYKTKVGRKYKNVLYNSIKIDGKINKNFVFNINIINETKDSSILLIKAKIEEYESFAKYFRKFDKLKKDILEMFSDLSTGLTLKVEKDLNFDNVRIGTIKLYTYSYSYYSSDILNINIYKDKIDDVSFNLLDNNSYNYSNILQHFYNKIDEGISIYENNKKAKDLNSFVDMIKNNKKNEEILLQYKTNRNSFSYFLWQVTKIFDKNKDKIIEYNINFQVDKYDNLLYFKDYNGHEYVICGGHDYLHVANNTSLYSSYFNICLPNEYKKISVYDYDICVDYITYDNNIYDFYNEDAIQTNIYCKFKFDNIINSKINLTYKSLPNSINKLRYDFTNINNQLQNIISDSKIFTSKESNRIINEYIHNNKSQMLDKYINISLQEINDKVRQLLYCILCEIKEDREYFTFRFNPDFTIEDGKKQLWLIKDFISTLNQIGIHNINNII
jgi:hypothetical protein